MKSVFEIEERTIMKEIASLKQLIDTFQPANYISPAFQWAQSPSEILLNIKFAHKLDAPATLNVEANTVNITSNSLLLLATNGRKNFKLELTFLNTIISAESTYAMASVGRMTITLKKQHNLKWSRLTESTQKLKHLHVWWDVAERYKKEIDSLPEVYTPPFVVEKATETENSTTESNASAETDNATTTSTAETTKSTETPPAESPKPKIPEKTQEDIANEKYEAAIDKLDQQLKVEVKSLEEDIKKRKKEIDLKGRLEKSKLDEELSQRKKELISNIHDQKQNINTDVNSVNNADSASMSVSSVSSEL